MHLLVTDRLACSRCGPDFGLILLSEHLVERRVLKGVLGCPNCRERYPIEGGYGDLRPAPRPEEPRSPGGSEDDPEAALRLAALLGVAEGPGLILLLDGSTRHADRIAAMVEGIEVVAAAPGLRRLDEHPGVSRVGIPDRLPFFSGALRGVVLEGARGRDLLTEGVRVLGRRSRLVFLEPDEGVKSEMAALGLELLMEAETVLVGARK